MTSERLKRQGIMLCYPFEEKRLAKWEPPYIVQPKLDGERCRAVFSGENNYGYQLFSSTGLEITSVPHLNQALNDLHLRTGITKELDGELYRHGMSFEELHSRVGRSVNYHNEFDQVQLHIFDVVELEWPQCKRTLWLKNLEFELPLKMVQFFTCDSLEDVWQRYVHFLNKGYEGIICRSFYAPYERKRSTNIMKFKPKKSDWYTVVGFQEELDKDGTPKGSLGSFVCIGDDGTRFNVGSGLTREQRQTLWLIRSTLPGHLCHVQYQHITPGKLVPRFPVFIDLVAGKLNGPRFIETFLKGANNDIPS